MCSTQCKVVDKALRSFRDLRKGKGAQETGHKNQRHLYFFRYFEQLKLLNRISHPQGLAIVQVVLEIQDNTMVGDLQVGGAE